MMLALLIFLGAAVGGLAGLKAGLHIGTHRTAEAAKLIRYTAAIDVLGRLVETPDALELRPAAQRILAADAAAKHQGVMHCSSSR